MNQPNKSLSVVGKDKLVNLRTMLEGAKSRIHAVLPTHMSPDRMIKIALVAACKNPKILNCTPQSMLTALMNASELGLEPFTGLNQAYIITYGTEATFMPSARGLCDLARRSGEISSIYCHVVYDRDVFECELGLTPKLKHIPCYDGKPRGNVILVYAVAQFKTGETQYEVMTKHELDKVRASSKSGNSGPWVTWTEEMYRKSCLKRLCKYLPMSVNLAKAITLDNSAENDDTFDVDSVDLSEMETKVERSSMDKMADKLDDVLPGVIEHGRPVT